MKMLLIFILSMFPLALFAQTTDQKVYLDKYWKEVNDDSLATYWRWTTYEESTNLYPMGEQGKKGYKLVHATDTISNSIKPSLLDGTYKWFDQKGSLTSEHIIKRGRYVSYKEYHSNGELRQHFDYEDHVDSQPNSWAVYLYNRKGSLKQSYYFMKQNGVWPKTR